MFFQKTFCLLCLNNHHLKGSVSKRCLTYYGLLKVGSSSPVHGEVYSIQHYVIKLVRDLRQVSGFLQVLRFPPPNNLNWPPRYNWNIVESGIKHHKPNQPIMIYQYPQKTWLSDALYVCLTMTKRVMAANPNFWIQYSSENKYVHVVAIFTCSQVIPLRCYIINPGNFLLSYINLQQHTSILHLFICFKQ